MRDHSGDAGGDPAVLEAKRDLREEAWAALADAGAARFPGTRGRIPNFVGAEAAAQRVRELPKWRDTGAVKANPDSPQWPVRQCALEDGLRLYMAVPRLAEQHPFLLVDPATLDVSPRKACSIKGSAEHGRPVAVGDVDHIDIVVSGCVAVDRHGARLGKGGGFADLEFALAVAAGLVTDSTVVLTTVHPSQIVDSGRIPVADHDVPVDVIVTPDETIWCDRRHRRPNGIHWGDLSEDKISAIPVLRQLRAQ